MILIQRCVLLILVNYYKGENKTIVVQKNQGNNSLLLFDKMIKYP